MMTDVPWVAYVGPFLFPMGEAGSRRVLGIAQTLALSGRDVVICSGNAEPTSAPVSPRGTNRTIRHVPLGDRPTSMRHAPLKAAATLFTWGTRATAWLDAQPNKPTHVIVYGGLASYAIHIQKWGATNRVPIIHDVVEWHEKEQFTGGHWNPAWASSEIALRNIYPRAAGIIAISEFLANYYDHIPTCVVPPTTWIDAVHRSVDQNSRRALELSYTGTPGNKESLGNLIKAVTDLGVQGDSIHLTLAGVGPEWVENLMPSAGGKQWQQYVTALGRVSHEEATRLVASADFTVLIRKRSRCTEAGFPTKLVESMAVGTPPIANLTSDLHRHLHDGENCILTRDSDDSIRNSLRTALDLTGAQRSALRSAAFVTARRAFDPREYTEPLNKLLEVTSTR